MAVRTTSYEHLPRSLYPPGEMNSELSNWLYERELEKIHGFGWSQFTEITPEESAEGVGNLEVPIRRFKQAALWLEVEGTPGLQTVAAKLWYNDAKTDEPRWFPPVSNFGTLNQIRLLEEIGNEAAGNPETWFLMAATWPLDPWDGQITRLRLVVLQ